MILCITVWWVTEAVPFFVASMCIPFLAIVMGVMTDDDGNAVPAEAATRLVWERMFNDTLALVLGGFSISAAVDILVDGETHEENETSRSPCFP
jgi:phosphate transporter